MTDQQDSDPQNAAEQLDDGVLGDDPDVLPGVDRFVDIGPMSSEDPTLLLGGADALDDVRTRDWREEPERPPGHRPPRPDDVPLMSLLEPGEAGPDQVDVEGQLLGEAERPADGIVGPEENALHIER